MVCTHPCVNSSSLDTVPLEESNSFEDTLSSSSSSLDAVSLEESKELDSVNESELLSDYDTMAFIAQEASYDSVISDLGLSGTFSAHESAGAPPSMACYTVGR